MIHALRQQLKRLRDDERGVSPVVGFVLIFALIMIVFTLYQSSVVPAQNKEVEFKHSQTVESEMSQLNDAIQKAGASGVPQSATVATGVQYPDRALAINPGSPVGSLKTSDSPETVTIEGLSDESGYWSTNPTFDTRLVNYNPTYNLLQQETTYTLENGMFIKNFENGNSLLKSDGSVISDNGRRINLVLIGGDYQKSAMAANPTATPISTSTEYHQLESNGGTINVPTSLSQDVWQNEIVDGAAGIQSVTVNDGVATLGLKNQKYELRLTNVSLGTDGEPSATYLKSEDPSDPSETIDAAVGESETFSVNVRDGFGNPYTSGGVTVTATTPDGSTSDVQLNEEGRATFTYEPTDEDVDDSPVEVKLSINDGDKDYETVTYELDVSDDDSGSDDGDNSLLGSGDITNGYGLEPSVVTIDSATAQNGNNKPITFEFHNRGEEKQMTAVEVQMNGPFEKQGSLIDGQFNQNEPINVNGRNVNLTNEPDVSGDSDNTFTLNPGETQSIKYIEHGQNVNEARLLLITVQYQYEYQSNGETKTGTDTATYAVSLGS